jgi:hypothetical protein
MNMTTTPYTKEEYHTLRKLIGSAKTVANLLGVDIRTIQRRESGFIIITSEASIALRHLLLECLASR